MIEFLGDGDYYSKWCRDTEDPVEREEKKLLLTMILNWPNAKCDGNALYRGMRRAFPLAFRICEDIKRNDHRNLSKSLQYCTAKAINAALFEAQHLGIAAIPDVDAIICPKRHKETVCALIGKKVHENSRGVCSMVSGIRYKPPRLDTVPALNSLPDLPASEPQAADCNSVADSIEGITKPDLSELQPGESYAPGALSADEIDSDGSHRTL